MTRNSFCKGLSLFSKRFVILLISVIIIRIVEYCWFQFNLSQIVPWHLFFTKSVNSDLQYIGLISIIGFLPYSILYVLNNTLGRLFNTFLNFFIILVQIVLTQYHLINQSLLTSVVFEFTIDELFNIIGSEMSESNYLIFTIWIFILLLSFIFLLKTKPPNKQKKYYIIAFIIGINSLINVNYIYRPSKRFKSMSEFLFANSKPIFLYKSFNANRRNNLVDFNEVLGGIKNYQRSVQKKYIDYEYPLVYENNPGNILEQYFQKSKQLPNIVLIISESLSSSYSVQGIGLEGGSLTLFTDSLAENGLYWSNFLSNAPRSFGVLPNILSSLPPSTEERGIINYKGSDDLLSYPVHQSIIKTLKENNYQTSHFYPGWSEFDNTSTYLKLLGVEHLIDETDFDPKYYPRYGDWGFSDFELYRKGGNYLSKLKNEKPSFSIFQTVAFHHPFDMVEPKYYEKEYLKDKINSLNLDSSLRNLSKLDSKTLSSIFASDEALHSLFDRLKKESSYENTIFIITGDHALDIRLTDHVLGKYHVPLIIYSPLLTQPKTFKGLSSHIDIAPSLLALLSGNFGLKLNKYAHWLGNGLDTSSVISFNNTIPLQVNSLIEPNFIEKDHIVLENKVYRMLTDFSTIQEEDMGKVMEVKNKFEAFKKVNQYTTQNNKIWHRKYLQR